MAFGNKFTTVTDIFEVKVWGHITFGKPRNYTVFMQ